MNIHQSMETRMSFLAGLQNTHDNERFEESWRQFNKRYTPKMYTWALGLGLSKADAEEVCQDLMIALLKRMKTFVYDHDRSFRGWLRTVTKHAVYDFIESQRRMRPTDDGTLQLLVEAKPLEDQFERFFDNEILVEARRQVEMELSATEVGKRNWAIFTRLESSDVSPSALAAEFGVKTQSIYVSKNRVIEELKAKVRWLDRDEENTV
jgi:RNA polymerase sigma factor (sigma-70 family)